MLRAGLGESVPATLEHFRQLALLEGIFGDHNLFAGELRYLLNRCGRQTHIVFQGNLALGLAQPIQDETPQDSTYPGQQFRLTAKGSAALPYLDEGFLHQITSDITVTDCAYAFTVQNGEVTAIEQSQRTIYPLTTVAAGLHERRLVQKKTPGDWQVR